MEKEHKNLAVYIILILLIFWTVVRKSALETDEALDEKVLLTITIQQALQKLIFLQKP